MKTRIAFDLDETLGTAITDGYSVIGFNVRKGCIDLLDNLKKEYELVLWTVSSRMYLEKILKSELRGYFAESYSWDEIPCGWKDIRMINAQYLIDDDIHHKNMAKKHNIEAGYIIIPAYGSTEDQHDPLLWIRQIYDYLYLSE